MKPTYFPKQAVACCFNYAFLISIPTILFMLGKKNW